MLPAARERVRYHFGPYEVLPDALELRKHGTRIRLREQAFRILLALLERPGELVTREELRHRLWPDDTFVDFDKSLNTAVNQIRHVLCDSAVEPRYIETVPRHGYRLTSEVRKLEEGDSLVHSDVHVAPAPVTGAYRRAWLAAGACAAVLALLGSASYLPRPGPVRTEAPRILPLTSYPGSELSPSFSPDGSHIAFAYRPPEGPDSDIYVQLVHGAEPLKVAATSANEISPAWSPDGSSIAYLKTVSDALMDLMLVPPTGGAARTLTRIRYPDTFEMLTRPDLLAWLPDGSAIVFPDAGPDDRSAIWRINVHSGRREKLTAPEPRTSHSLPRVRHDGKRLAFQQIGGSWRSQVFAAALSPEGLPSGDPVLAGHGMVIGPLGWIGNDLLMLSRTDTQFDLHRWSGSGPARKLDLPQFAGPGARLGAGDVSRDGSRLAITLARPSIDVWEMEMSPGGEGLHPKPLIVSTFMDLSVDYSRDGRQIVFKSTRSGSHEAWMAAPDGSQLRQITRAGGVGDPRLSPDGKQIVFDASEHGNVDVFVADVATGAVRQITDDPARDDNPRWSRDGEWVLFDSDRTGQREIWKLQLSSGAVFRITRSGGKNPFESPDGKYVYFGREEPDGGYVYRIPSGGGAEERLFPSLVNWASLSMGATHLYFVRDPVPFPPGYGVTIHSYELSSARIRKVADTGFPVVTLAASPDERRLIYGRAAPFESDLMLVEGLLR